MVLHAYACFLTEVSRRSPDLIETNSRTGLLFFEPCLPYHITPDLKLTGFYSIEIQFSIEFFK